MNSYEWHESCVLIGCESRVEEGSMGNVRQVKGNQAMLRRKQARWNRTQFLALSVQFMSGILENVAFSVASGNTTRRERNSTRRAPFS